MRDYNMNNAVNLTWMNNKDTVSWMLTLLKCGRLTERESAAAKWHGRPMRKGRNNESWCSAGEVNLNKSELCKSVQGTRVIPCCRWASWLCLSAIQCRAVADVKWPKWKYCWIWNYVSACDLATENRCLWALLDLASGFYDKLVTVFKRSQVLFLCLLSEQTVWFRDLTKFQFSIVTQAETALN
jgi:hypothetical protein